MSIDHIVTSIIKHNERVEERKEVGNIHPGLTYDILACKSCKMIRLPEQYGGQWTAAYNPAKIDVSRPYITLAYCPEHQGIKGMDIYALIWKSTPHPFLNR